MCALLQWIEHVFISDIVGYMLMVITYFVVDMRFKKIRVWSLVKSSVAGVFNLREKLRSFKYWDTLCIDTLWDLCVLRHCVHSNVACWPNRLTAEFKSQRWSPAVRIAHALKWMLNTARLLTTVGAPLESMVRIFPAFHLFVFSAETGVDIHMAFVHTHAHTHMHLEWM